MALVDLKELSERLVARFKKEFEPGDMELPEEFKKRTIQTGFTEKGDSIQYFKYSLVHQLREGKMYVPNMWIYMASFFAEYYTALDAYFSLIQQEKISSKVLSELKDNPEAAKKFVADMEYSDKEKGFLTKFLSDYDWWNGTQSPINKNCFYSPIYKFCGMVNIGQRTILYIWRYLSQNPDMLKLIREEANKIKQNRPDIQSTTELNQEKNSYIISAGSNKRPEQIIYFGAPGTGKSHSVEKKIYGKVNPTFDEKAVKDPYIFRVTFHPDTDYASFVGCYKPVQSEKSNDLTYAFAPQVFVNAYVTAWKNQDQQVYLVIEEINRGNCAQIFGDVFQLLDRDENGLSSYFITPDSDLKSYLETILGKDSSMAKQMRLPPNLSIIATMNTSDQSLFPIDSAFKRRWDWKYIPIKPSTEKFMIQVGNHSHDWWEFLEKINEKISEITQSEDKQMGYWFVKPRKGAQISADQFANKVLAYLWNDVFKDFMQGASTPFKIGEKSYQYREFFKGDGEVDEIKVGEFISGVIGKKAKEEVTAETTAG